MKSYPKINGPENSYTVGLPCVAFNKLDGSNLRFEYNRKSGWYKFGTRTRLIDEKTPMYGEAIGIFKKKYAEGVAKILQDKYPKVESAIAYCEFFGPHSFAGQHDISTLHNLGFKEFANNDPKDLVLFDVDLYKQCMIAPREFVARFGHLDIAKVIYEGRLTQQFVNDVRDGKYEVNEGVVTKGGRSHNLWMMKIKTTRYLDELKKRWGDLWIKYGE